MAMMFAPTDHVDEQSLLPALQSALYALRENE
jgi:hypothetical protein